MIEVIVRNEYDVDGRQVFEGKSWREEALGAGPLCGRRAFIPNRIDEDIDAVDFDQR
jgi:hypothetical protein